MIDLTNKNKDNNRLLQIDHVKLKKIAIKTPRIDEQKCLKFFYATVQRN